MQNTEVLSSCVAADMTTTPSKRDDDMGPDINEMAVHVHRAADKLFEQDLIDPTTLRYDYLYMASLKLREFDELKAERNKFRDILMLVLPMAKGYAYENNVGCNLDICLVAQEALHPPTNPIAPGSEDET